MSMDEYALYINLAGLAVILVGLLGLVFRAFRHWRKGLLPLGLIGLGVVITGFPPLYRLIVPIDLGPRETVVNGQRHITLTGWDRKDYSLLGSKHDVVVLQMANPEVTDQTLEHLKGMNRLEELDLNNTQVSDSGLKILRDLPALASLRLQNTKVTEQGFQESLAGKATLKQLDLRGTQVSREAVHAWREANAGRRAMR